MMQDSPKRMLEPAITHCYPYQSCIPVVVAAFSWWLSGAATAAGAGAHDQTFAEDPGLLLMPLQELETEGRK